MATSTAANWDLTLAILNLFPVPQTLQGYAGGSAFTADQFAPLETVMGVDDYLSAGWVPVEKKMTISIQADSPSAAMFDAWPAAAGGRANLHRQRRPDPAVAQPGIHPGRGFLSTYTPFPEARKILQPRTFGITWANDLLPVPI